MKNYSRDITIIIVTFQSTSRVIDFIKKIPKIFRIIIVDNSKDISLLKKFKKYKNIKIYFHKNDGFGTSLNFAVNKIKTDYFFQISPDLKFNFNQLKLIYREGKKLKNNFSALGPRFINANKKGHIQSNINEEVGNVEAVHGSAIYINKKVFKKIGRIDENLFLYFEENDYCLRGKKLGYKSYQINRTFITKQGQTVKYKKKKDKEELLKLLSWHYIWSEFYFYKKHKGYLLAYIYFAPVLLRTIFRILLSKIMRNNSNLVKYKFRFKGLLSSMQNQNSYLRF
jgi:N-acetylglucosaminyl-diphospho-decaprenol L-rhamnosyltransferase